MRLLLASGLDPNEDPIRPPASGGPKHVMECAAEGQHPSSVALLKSYGLNASLPKHQVAWFAGKLTREFALALHSAGLDPREATDPWGQGRTPLFFATDLEATRWLLEQGLDPNAMSRSGDTAFTARIRNDCCLKSDGYSWLALLAATLDPTHPSFPLGFAAQTGKLALVEQLLDRGANIQGRDSRGWTALHFAAGDSLEDFQEVVSLLISRGLSLETPAPNGVTPLVAQILASRTSLGTQFTEHLLSLKADPNARFELASDSELAPLGQITVLHVLVTRERDSNATIEMIKKLRNYGAKRVKSSRGGVTPKDLVKRLHQDAPEWGKQLLNALN